jgi:hypothetical protein
MGTQTAIFAGFMLTTAFLLIFIPPAEAQTISPTKTIALDTWIGDIEIDPVRPLAYLSARDSNNIIVLSLTSLSLVNNITVGYNPSRMTIDPLTDRLYCAVAEGPGIAVVNLTSQSLEETWSLTYGASDLAVGRPGRLYVTTWNSLRRPLIIDTSNGTNVGEISDGRLIREGSILEISPDKESLYIGECLLSPVSLYKYNVTTDNPTLELEDDHGSLGSNLQDIAISPDGSLVYLACGGPYYIQAINTTDFSSDGSYYIDAYPSSVAVSGNGSIILGAKRNPYDFTFQSFDSDSYSEIDMFEASEEVLRVRMDAVGRYILAFTGDTYYDNYFLDIYWNIYQGPPKANIISPPPHSGWSSTDVPIEIEFKDPDGVDQSTLSLTLDGVPLPANWDPIDSTLKAQTSGLSTGRHNVVAQASDDLGYGPNIVSWSFIVDTESPSSQVEELPQFTKEPYLTIDAVPMDDQGVVSIEIYQRYNNGNWTHVAKKTAPPWSIIFSGLNEGIYEFYSIAEDRARNREGIPASCDAKTCVDLSSPKVKIVEPHTYDWISGSNIMVQWNASDSISGISNQWLSLDGELAVNLSSNVDEYMIKNPSEGHHSILLEVVDEAGYTNYDRTDIWIDNTPPDIHITSPLGNPRQKSGPVIISWLGIDNGSGIDHYTISINNGSEIPLGYGTSITFPQMEDGDYTFSVRAYDCAGNVAKKNVKTKIDSQLQDSSDFQWVLFLLAFLIVFNGILIVTILYIFIKSRESSQHSKDKSLPEKEDQPPHHYPPPPPSDLIKHYPPPPPP